MYRGSRSSVCFYHFAASKLWISRRPESLLSDLARMPKVSVKDVNQQEFVRELASYLKKYGVSFTLVVGT